MSRNINDVLTDPTELVRSELKNAGFDIDHMNVPKRVFLLADSLYDAMLSRNCGKYKYPLGGKLFVFNKNEEIGFIKGHMCSPAIATQAEDLITGGVKELIHIGFAGGLQPDLNAGDIVLTDKLSKLLTKKTIRFRRGIHWTTDAGYRETWGQILEYREKGALCVEMEGVGLFTIANYRKCTASAIYIISDVLDNDWKLGWGEKNLNASINRIIDMIICTAME